MPRSPADYEQHQIWGTFTHNIPVPGFLDKDGLHYDGHTIAVKAAAATRGTSRGKHISIQLEALGLTEAMNLGHTPWPLPYSWE